MHRQQRLKRQDSTRRVRTALEALCQAIQLFGEISGDPGMPNWVGVASKSVSMIIKMVKQTKANMRDVETLFERITALNQRLNRWCQPNTTVPPSIVEHITRLFDTWDRICEDIVELQSQSKCVKFIRVSMNAGQISEMIGRFSGSMTECTLEVVLEIGVAVANIQDRLKDGEIIAAVESLNPAVRARFDSSDARRECLQGTRKQVLLEIDKWVAHATAPLSSSLSSDSTLNRRIFWLNGLAGTGKTTIAYTIARRYHTAHPRTLAASFFCSRFDAACRNTYKIFLTVAYQLAFFHPPFAEELVKVIRTEPLIAQAAPSQQLEALLVNPLRALPPGKKPPPCFVLFDAVDECDESSREEDSGGAGSIVTPYSSATSVVISTLLQHIDELAPIRFLVTSRPERHISIPFDQPKHVAASSRLILHEVPKDIVSSDITQYIVAAFSEYRAGFALPDDWPSRAQITALVKHIDGLFVYASTIIRFIFGPGSTNPRKQLDLILSLSPGGSRGGPNLDGLYAQVLSYATHGLSPQALHDLKLTLSSVILVQEPLSPSTLARLVDQDVNDVLNSLLPLHSVIAVPRVDPCTTSDPIRVVHLTLPEYLLNEPTSSGEPSSSTSTSGAVGAPRATIPSPETPPILIDAQGHHTMLLLRCLAIMEQHLKYDICDIGDPSLALHEVSDLSDKLETCIPQELRYSCRYWASHLERCKLARDVLEALLAFARRQLLHWLEVCCLLGNLRDAIMALNSASRTIQHIGNAVEDVLALFSDAERFILAAFPTISTAPLHVYHSTMQFLPHDTTLPKAYGNQCDHSVRTVRGLGSSWSPCLGTVVGHGGSDVNCVAFAPCGPQTFASSGVDYTVKLWDATSCVLLLALRGHTKWVWSARYSRDGAYIVSASGDKTVRIWNTASGVPVKVLEGHTDHVRAAVFTPDGKRIVSGSDDHSVKVWDVETGNCIATLEKHLYPMTSVLVSPDGTLVASASDQGASEPVYLWDLTSLSSPPRPIPTAGAYAFVFTPDSTRLIIQDTTHAGLDVWDVRSLTRVQRLCGPGFPSKPVTSLTISADGTRLACASPDHRVLLVDARDGSVVRELYGHTSYITSLSFGSDGTRLVSSSRDGSIRLWDTTAMVDNAAPALDGLAEAPVPPIAAATFSTEGWLYTGTNSSDIVDVYDPQAAACQRVSSLHSEPASAREDLSRTADESELFLSPDGSLLVHYRVRSHIPVFNIKLMTDPWRSSSQFPIRGESGWMYRLVYDPNASIARMWDSIVGYRRHGFGGVSSPMVFSEDSKHFARSSDASIIVHDVSAHRDVLVLDGHTQDVLCVAFSLDGRLLVSSSKDHSIRVWDMKIPEGGISQDSSVQRTALQTLEGHRDHVNAMAFSADRSYIVSGSDDDMVRVWSVGSGECVGVFRGHTNSVTTVAFTPEGDTVLSASQRDETLRVWDTRTKSCLAVYNFYSWHHSLNLAPDGSGILVGDEDTQRLIRLWATDNTPPDVVARLPWLPRRTWPAYRMDEDRWVWSVAPGRKARRMCRIQGEWKEMIAHRGTILVFEGGQIVDVANFTQYLGI